MAAKTIRICELIEILEQTSFAALLDQLCLAYYWDLRKRKREREMARERRCEGNKLNSLETEVMVLQLNCLFRCSQQLTLIRSKLQKGSFFALKKSLVQNWLLRQTTELLKKKVKTNIFYVLRLTDYNCQSVQPSVKMSWIILALELTSKLDLIVPWATKF